MGDEGNWVWDKMRDWWDRCMDEEDMKLTGVMVRDNGGGANM